jgi:methionine synthase II (cobalamin-independent)
MFSTLLGPLPPIDGEDVESDLGARVVANVADLEAAGLELLSSGVPAVAATDAPEEMAAAWAVAAGATTLPVKQVVLGPYAGSRDLDELGLRRAAERVAGAITVLAAAGCPFVEIEEPDLLPIVTSAAERDRFLDAHRWLFAALGTTAPVHCSLTAGGGNLDVAGAATFFDLPYASYAFDLIAGPDNWRLIAAAPGDRGIICGALSARADGDETRELLVWAAHYAASTGGRGLDRVGLANAGSLAGLPREIAVRKLRRVAEATRIAATESPADMASLLDSRVFGPGGRRRR